MNGKGFSTEALFPHTDRSGLALPPKYLLNLFVENAGIGGKATLCSVAEVIDHLSDHRPSAIDALKQPSTVFTRKDKLLRAPMLEMHSFGRFLFRFRCDNGIHINPVAMDEYKYVCDVIADKVQKCLFDPGSGYLINNHNTLHGRTSFIGEREVWRILADGDQAS